jgi:hypothetical protein
VSHAIAPRVLPDDEYNRARAYTAALNLFPLLYRAGVPASLLARLYGDVR